MAREETIQVSLVKSSLYNTTIASLRSEAKELQTAFGSIKIGNTAKALKEQATASKAAAQAAINEAKANKEAANAEKARYQAVKELENATKAHLQAQKEAQNVATAKIKTEKEAQNAIAATARAEKAKIQALAAADKAANGAARSMQGYANAMMNTIKQIVGFAGATQSIRYALTEMKSMSDEMVTYRKVTGATAQEMEKIRSASYSTAKKYGQTPSDFLAAASEMARAGYGQNSAAMAELATKTQLVGDMTADAASKFLLAVDAGYKYQGNIESLTAVLDAANEVDNNFATSIEKISEGMTLVASLAGSVHVPVEQLIAALGTMTATTQRSGGEMARGLRSIMLNVLGDTTTEIEEGVTVTEENIQSLTDALEKYGDSSIAAARKAGKLINPMQAIASLAKAWKAGKLDESTLFGISKDIAGQRYYNAFSSLIQNYDMYESMLGKIAGSAGSAQKEVDNMLDSWTVKANQAKTAWVELVNNTISENFIKGLLDGGIAALEFTGNLENLALMAGGAYEAIKSLSAGINNLRNHKGFGGFNAGMTALGLGVAAIGAWKSAYEKAIKDAQQAAAKQVAEALNDTTYKTVAEIEQKYISTEKDDIETLKTLQDELNKAVGEQGTAIDLVNGKYEAQKTLLKSLTKSQKEAAETALRASLSNAVSTWNSNSDLNGTFTSFLNDMYVYSPARHGNVRYSQANVGIDAYNIPGVKEFIDSSDYLRVFSSISGNHLYFNKPTDTEGILAFYKEVEDFYTYLGTHTETGEKASTGMKSIGEQYSQMYTELGKFVSTVRDAADPVKAAQEGLDELKKGLGEIGGSTGTEAGNAIDGVASKFNTLAGAIDAATKAKTIFDDAMKTTKADAFNDYATAFKTLQEEIDAGRVNSTAFYAAARMVLGDDAYNATGGTSQGVMAALNKRGKSGSVREAWDILSATYKNEAGKEIQGYGIYELLTRTKGFTKALTDANGKPLIPELTQADLNLISQQWGDISKDYILAVINALDQHDKKGKATDAAVKAEEKETDAGNKAAETTSALTDSKLALAKAEYKEAEAAKEATESVQEATDSLESASESMEGAGESTGEASPAKKSADELLESLTQVEEALERINATEINPQISETISGFLTDIGNIQNGISLDIISSGNTDAAVTAAQTIARDLVIVNALESSGISISAEVTGTLLETLETIVGYIDDPETLGTLRVTLEANDLLTPEAETIIAGVQEKKAQISVALPDAGQKSRALDLVANPERGRTADINVEAPNAGEVSEEIDNAARDRESKITVIYHEDRGNGSYAEQFETEDGTTYTSYGGKFATGTRNHPGGLSLVNDGSGPELIVDSGRAFIAGGGKPAIVNLQKGAKVFTASQTRSIFAGSGVPAYAQGTRSLSLGYVAPGASLGIKGTDVSEFGTATLATGEQKDDSGKQSGNSNSGKQSGNSNSGKQSGNSNSGNAKQTDEKAFSTLKEMIDYIISRIGEGLDEQLDILDKQIEELKLQREAADQQNELEEKQQAVAEAQKDLEEALNERTVRYLGDDGKWHWMADARNVQSAQEKLQDAQKSLADYQDEMAFNAQVEALEKQKEALQAEYNSITKAWDAIQKGVSTPTGELGELIAAVLTGGTPQQQTGAASVRDYLIGTLLKGGSYSGNYSEALDSIANATAGSPIMPDGTSGTLASLIATGGGLTGSVADALKGGTAGTMASVIGAMGQGGGDINYNYFVNGMKIGSDAASTMTMSQIMSGLTVYAGQ